MYFEDPVYFEDLTHPDLERMREQYWYLKGTLLADPEYRMDDHFDPKLIDPFGNGTAAFWRGVIETPKAGAIRMDAAGGREYRHPAVELRGSNAFLTAFLSFLEEHLQTPTFSAGGESIKFDDDGRLAFQAGGGVIRVRGPKAQSIVRLLYIDQTVRRATPSQTVDAIVVWTSGKR